MAQTGWCVPMQQHCSTPSNPSVMFMRFFSATRAQCPRKVRTRVKFAVVRDCARPSVSPSQATDVELVRVAMPHTQRNSVSEIGLHGEPLSSALFFCFLNKDVSWMFAARQCESVSTELHGKRRGVSRCGVSVLPCGGHWI